MIDLIVPQYEYFAPLPLSACTKILFGNTDWLEHTFLWSQPTNNFDHKWMFELICQSTQTKYPFVYQGWRPRPTEEMSRFSRGFGSDLVSILGSGSNLDFLAAAVTHEMKNALACHDWNRLFMSMDNASNLAPVGVVQMARVCSGIG